MNKIISGLVVTAIVGLSFVGFASAKVDRVSSWNLTNPWILSFNYGGFWNHDIMIAIQNADGTFSGTGGYPAGGPYSINETITGSLDVYPF